MPYKFDWMTELQTLTFCAHSSGEKRIERGEIDMDISPMDGPLPKKVKGEKFKNVGKPKQKNKQKGKHQLATR